MRWVPRGNTRRGRHQFACDERGTVTAEFAVVLPAVLVVLALVIGGIVLNTTRLTLASAAADIARLEARGDTALARERFNQAGDDLSIDRERRGALVCVTLRAGSQRGLLSSLAVTGEACAAVTDTAIAGRTLYQTIEREPT